MKKQDVSHVSMKTTQKTSQEEKNSGSKKRKPFDPFHYRVRKFSGRFGPLQRLIFRNKVEKNRYIFLQYLEREYNFPKIKAALWNGTALHLLELGKYISPDMHQAARRYFSLSQHILKKVAPKRAISPLGKPARKKRPTPVPSTPWEEGAVERSLENEWREVSALLVQEKVKNLLDRLDEEDPFPLIDHLLKTKSELKRLQKGLGRLQCYLDALTHSSTVFWT